MDFEALAEVLVPLAFFAIVGGLIALKMLKPYGDRILELIKEIQKDRHQALSETRDLQQVHDRLDMLAERQDFLESLVKNRLEAEELPRGPETGRLAGAASERSGEGVEEDATAEPAAGSGSPPSGGATSGPAAGS